LLVISLDLILHLAIIRMWIEGTLVIKGRIRTLTNLGRVIEKWNKRKLQYVCSIDSRTISPACTELSM